MLDKVEQPSGLQTFGMYIDGESVAASNGRTMESLNPYSGKPWATVPDGTREDINTAVAAARKAFDSGPWSQMTATQRAALLRRLGDIIKRDAEDLARCPRQRQALPRDARAMAIYPGVVLLLCR